MIESLLTIDRAVGRAVAQWAGHFPALDVSMAALTLVGSYSGLWTALGIVSAVMGNRRAREGLVRIFWSLALAGFVTTALFKPLVGRERPRWPTSAPTEAGALVTSLAHGPSFPSGHAVHAGAGAYALSLVWPRRRAALALLAALVGFSRVYFGVHYPLDVVAGLVLGVAAARLATGGTPCYISTSVHGGSRVPR
ncbi:MAG: phosphatase PAP2 family protein [Vicinamibacterales bacterium]